MGTNYYLYTNICSHCGRSDRMHIGKSSGGWCFSLHVEPEDPSFPHSLKEWEALWNQPGTRIENEYGEEVGNSAMKTIIADRSWVSVVPISEELRLQKWFQQNHAIQGPRGLARHTLDIYVGWGDPDDPTNGRDSTWDRISGVFS